MKMINELTLNIMLFEKEKEFYEEMILHAQNRVKELDRKIKSVEHVREILLQKEEEPNE
jgi:predicted nuclease of restriction endonuclease-like (RecB) superfamily